MQKKLTISTRGKTVPASPIRELVPFADAAKARGIKIHHINIGDPDFPLPEEIKKSLQEVSQTINRLPYPSFRGQKNLLSSWKKYFRDIKIPWDLMDEDIIVTAGASDGLVLAVAAITDPEDEILVFEPFYAPYATYASFTSVNLVAVTLEPKCNFHLPSKEAIIAKITPKTKAVFFTNPNNPTGTVFTREEIRLILDIAKEYNLFVISDETYRGMVFDNRESVSILQVADEYDLQHIIVADSLSKRLNVCGARMGVIVSKNKELMTAAFRFAQGRPYPAFIEQEIVTPMLENSLPYISWLSKEYEKRRDAFITSLENHLQVNIHQPEGAFYAMLQLPIANTNDFAKWLLTDFQQNYETVMVSPGSGFYVTEGKGMNEIRVAYVLEETELERVAELLALAVKEYNSKK